jgi:hypothetical protein
MKKKIELRFIDEFIDDYNGFIERLDEFDNQPKEFLERSSGEDQESPDAICILGKTKFIAIEQANAVSQLEMRDALPKRNISEPYDSSPVISEIINVIKDKSTKDYGGKNVSEVWLLLTGVTFIFIDALEKRLRKEHISTKFNRIFLHRGTFHSICELTGLLKRSK